MIIKKAVCMHEEDYGTLWKHTEYRTGHSEVRRSRRLVLSFISTIANYEYGFYWYFYQVTSALQCQPPCLHGPCVHQFPVNPGIKMDTCISFFHL